MLWLLRHAGCRSFLYQCSWRACKQERLACVSLVLHLWIQPAVQTTVCPEQSQHLFLLFFPKECSMPSMSMVFTLLWVEAIYSKRCGLCANIVLSSWGLGLKLWAAFPMGLSHLTVPKFTVPERHQAMLLCCVLLAWLWRFLSFWALFSLPWNIGALRDSWTSFLKITFILCLACIYGHHIQTRVSDSLGLEYGWLRAKPRKVLCKSNVCSWPLGHLSSPRHSFCSPRWLSQCLRPFSPLLEKSWIDFSWGHQDCLAVC